MSDTKTMPRAKRGTFVSRECPICDCGKLQYEGRGVWRCDGLADPGHYDKELTACEYTHIDGDDL